MHPAENGWYPSYIETYPIDDLPPAAEALMAIGMPAMPAIIELAKEPLGKLGQEQDAFGDYIDGYHGVLEWMIERIGHGHDYAVWRLEKAIANEPDKQKQAQLQKVLEIARKRLRSEQKKNRKKTTAQQPHPKTQNNKQTKPATAPATKPVKVKPTKPAATSTP